MNLLIVKNDRYLDMLSKHPGLTIYQKIDNVRTHDAVHVVEREAKQFIARQPAYVAQILNRMPTEYKHYQRSEKPSIQRMSGDPMYVHSSAGPYEIEILKTYRNIKNSINTIKHRINISA